MRLLIALLIACFASVCGAAQNGADLSDIMLFPKKHPWRWNVSGYSLHPDSAKYIENFKPFFTGKTFPVTFKDEDPYTVLNGGEQKIKVTVTQGGDDGEYPIASSYLDIAANRYGGFHRLFLLDKEHLMLYELLNLTYKSGECKAEYGAIFDLKSPNLRKEGNPSAEDSGLSVLAGLIRYDEVSKGEINHALRFTIDGTTREYIYPATYSPIGVTQREKLPLGLRLRLKKDFNDSAFGMQAKVVINALKKYGMIITHTDYTCYFTYAEDSRWNKADLATLEKLKGEDFEVVKTVDEKGKPVFPSADTLDAGPLDKIKVFPSKPVPGGKLRFSNLPSGKLELKVFDAAGKQICEIPSKGEVVLDLKGIAAGEYTIKIKDTKENEKTIKIVVY